MGVKNQLVFYILAFSVSSRGDVAPAPSAAPNLCAPQYQEKAKQTIDRILHKVSEKYQSEDISDWVAYYFSTTKKYCLTPKQYDVEFLWKAREVGAGAEADALVKLMDKRSWYGGISREKYRYQLMLRTAGRKPDGKTIDDLTRRASESSQRRKTTCTTVDLRSKFPLPPRDQDSIGWCYAYASADLLSFKTKKPVSAVDLAITYNSKTTPKEKDKDDNGFFSSLIDKVFGNKKEEEVTIKHGGFAKDAMTYGLEKGLCTEDQVPSDHGSDLAIKLRAIIEYDKRVKETNKSGAQTQDCNCSMANAIFSRVPASDINAILRTTKKSEILEALDERACTERIHPTVGLSTTEVDLGAASITGELDKILNSKNPALIDYYADFLEDGQDSRKVGGPHSSLIVGRKFNQQTQSCEFLIRNSWGRNCKDYDPYLRCEEGNVWVPEGVLSQTIYRITHAD